MNYKQILYKTLPLVFFTACGSDTVKSAKEFIDKALNSNDKPIAFFKLNENKYNYGSTVILDGSDSYDTDGNIISYLWSSNIDGILGKQKIISISDLSIGKHKIELEVTDNQGEIGTLTLHLTIFQYEQENNSNNELLRNSAGYIQDFKSNLVWSDNEHFQGDFQDAFFYCSNLNISNINDWRLPTIKELWNLADRSYDNPTADTQIWAFLKSKNYWTSTSVNSYGYLNNKWTVNFDNGQSQWFNKDDKNIYVKCVSGNSNNFPKLTRDSKLQVIFDKTNRLMWEDGKTVAEFYNSDYNSYCSNLNFAGFTDWRLPTISELFSITDPTRISEPFIYTAFHNTKNGEYLAKSFNKAIYNLPVIDFETGLDGNRDSQRLYVRCVRNY